MEPDHDQNEPRRSTRSRTHGEQGRAEASALLRVASRVQSALWASLLLLLAVPAAARERLAYYSDYFSFTGRDAAGHVAFALDNNRGQDGDAFQAEHFCVLHEEDGGWQPLQGSGLYLNPSGALESIPDSASFQFRGTPASGLVIESPVNGLQLEIEPISTRLARERGSDRYRMGSAAAVLRWKGRTVSGRVIHEHLRMEGWNRLTRTYFGYWNAFHGLYLLTEDPVNGALGDFYLHRQQSRKMEPLAGRVDGFAGSGEEFVRLEGTEVSVRDKNRALGFYRWPGAWSGHWNDPAHRGDIDFDLWLSGRKNFRNWVIGGFAMGIVKGVVSRGGRTPLHAYGLGELIQ